eukprot:1482702-Amphidinium_carterae.1
MACAQCQRLVASSSNHCKRPGLIAPLAVFLQALPSWKCVCRVMACEKLVAGTISGQACDIPPMSLTSSSGAAVVLSACGSSLTWTLASDGTLEYGSTGLCLEMGSIDGSIPQLLERKKHCLTEIQGPMRFQDFFAMIPFRQTKVNKAMRFQSVLDVSRIKVKQVLASPFLACPSQYQKEHAFGTSAIARVLSARLTCALLQLAMRCSGPSTMRCSTNMRCATHRGSEHSIILRVKRVTNLSNFESFAPLQLSDLGDIGFRF